MIEGFHRFGPQTEDFDVKGEAGEIIQAVVVKWLSQKTITVPENVDHLTFLE